MRLASWMPFEHAREVLADGVGIRVSKATARRLTLRRGEAALAVCAVQEQRLLQEAPSAPAGADRQMLSADGAMVHLVGGEWAEVKTVALGEVSRKKQGEVCIQHLSYFSRLSDATRFEQAALIETHRRGRERASEVCAVQDGAQWLQGLVDYHRADAIRILDFAHAAEYVNELGEAVRAAAGKLPARWLQGVLHRLKHQGPERVLTHLTWLTTHYPSSVAEEKLTYLRKREAQMQYPAYQEAGLPIGSGCVESANKLVVETRLKGAGMRWARHNVNAMLVLRNAVCNRQWKQTSVAAGAQRQALRARRQQAESQQRLTRALGTIVLWSVRRSRVSHPAVHPAASPPAQPLVPPPIHRLGTGYSWHKPFLKRSPSPSFVPAEVGAKK